MRKLYGIILSSLAFIPFIASAQLDPEKTGLKAAGSDAYGGDPMPLSQFIGERLIAPALSLVGVIFFILFIYAGFLWMTAGGNETQVGKAKKILVGVVIGAIIVFGAFALSRALFAGLSGESVFG